MIGARQKVAGSGGEVARSGKEYTYGRGHVQDLYLVEARTKVRREGNEVNTGSKGKGRIKRERVLLRGCRSRHGHRDRVHGLDLGPEIRWHCVVNARASMVSPRWESKASTKQPSEVARWRASTDGLSFLVSCC